MKPEDHIIKAMGKSGFAKMRRELGVGFYISPYVSPRWQLVASVLRFFGVTNISLVMALKRPFIKYRLKAYVSN